MSEFNDVAIYRIVLPVKDIDEAKKFYTKIFNTTGYHVSPGRFYIDLNGIILACYDPITNGQQESKRHNEDYVYFSVSDVNQVYKRVEEAGAKLDKENRPGIGYPGKVEQRPWGEVSFYTRDPSGNPLCFTQRGTEFISGTI